MDFKRTGHRNMSLFFVGKLISVLGSSLYTFVAGLTVLKLTDQAAILGYVDMRFPAADLAGALRRCDR